MNSNPIKVLHINTFAPSDAVINAICTLKTFTTLWLQCWQIDWLSSIAESHMKQLARDLRDLTEFHIRMANGSKVVEKSISSVLSLLPMLTKLTIKLDLSDFRSFSKGVKGHVRDFHARFVQTNAEIDVINTSGSKVSTSKDRVFKYAFGHTVELHWMDNLNGKNVRKVINECNAATEVKFINNCAEPSVDISAIVDRGCRAVTCLDIRSIGPISANGNVSETIYFGLSFWIRSTWSVWNSFYWLNNVSFYFSACRLPAIPIFCQSGKYWKSIRPPRSIFSTKLPKNL